MRSIKMLVLLVLSVLTACSIPMQPNQPSLSNTAPAAEQRTDTAAQAAAATPETPSAQPADRFSDPFAYCAAVTTVNVPDARYTGDPVPPEIVQKLHRVSGGQGAVPDWMPQTVQWRCMDGKVFACTIGANLPCSEKADTSQTPTIALREFCSQHPNQPARAEKNSVYVWTCAGAIPTIERQWTEADAAGFIAKIWYQIEGP